MRPSVGCAVRAITGGVLLTGLIAAAVRSATPPNQVVPAAAVPPIDPPAPQVVLRVRVPAEAAPGKELAYRLTAENTSRGPAHHVTVRVPLPANAKFVRATPAPAQSDPVLTWKLGTLASCTKKEITLVLQPAGEGELAVCARVQIEHGQCVRTRIGKAPAKAAPPTMPPAPGGEAILQLRKTGPVEAARYDMLTYRLEVANVGRGTARQVVVEDELPKGLDFSNGKPAPAGEKPLRWELGELPPGQSRTIEFQAIPSEVGALRSTAVVRAAGGLSRETTHSLRVGQPALAVRLSGPRARLVGRPTSYQITVSNPGTLPATNVQVSDELPADIAFVSAAGGGRFDGAAVRWNLGTLAPGARRRVDLVVRARRAGTLKNVCTATADRGLTEQARAETRFEAGAGLALEIDRPADPARVGDEAAWTVRVLNPGKTPEKAVDVTVTLPEGVRLLDVRLGKGAARAETSGRSVKLPQVPALAAGTEQTAVLRVKYERAGEMSVSVDAVSAATGSDRPVKAEEAVRVEGP